MGKPKIQLEVTVQFGKVNVAIGQLSKRGEGVNDNFCQVYCPFCCKNKIKINL